MKLHLRVHSEALWYSEHKQRLNEACVLVHRTHCVQSVCVTVMCWTHTHTARTVCTSSSAADWQIPYLQNTFCITQCTMCFLSTCQLQSTKCYCKCLLYLRSSVLCALIQTFQNITCNLPPPHPFTSTSTVHDPSASTFLPRIYLLQCLVECIIFNFNIYIIVLSIVKLCDFLCVLANTSDLSTAFYSFPCLWYKFQYCMLLLM